MTYNNKKRTPAEADVQRITMKPFSVRYIELIIERPIDFYVLERLV